MKVVTLHTPQDEQLKNFLEEVGKGNSRPAIYLGLDSEGTPVLHVMGGLTWKEMSYIKAAFDAHFLKDWMGLFDCE